jgi:hypothetical protein
MLTYKLFVPKQAVGANLVYFDLFVPTTTQYNFLLKSLRPVASGAVDVTGILAVDLLLTRTSAVGTGGTAATFGGTAIDAATINGLNTVQPLASADVTARLTPTGGATAGAVLSFRSVFSEETNAGTYTAHEMVSEGGITIPCGSGIRVVQGAVASVGNIAFEAVLKVARR